MQHEPTKRTRMQVQTLAGYGFSPREIARLLGHRVETIRDHYASELELGQLMATAKVASSLFRMATRRSKPSPGAAVAWLKLRGGAQWLPSTRYVGRAESARLLAGTVEEGEEAGAWDELLHGTDERQRIEVGSGAGRNGARKARGAA